MAKEYFVMKDGAELKTYKSLPAAKALAEKEGAEVYAEGECVYSASVDPVIPSDLPIVEETKELVQETKVQEVAPDKYTLLRKMNVRKEPSLVAEKLAVLNKGAMVEVEKKVDDWLYLTDGTFIYYEGGKNASKLPTNA